MANPHFFKPLLAGFHTHLRIPVDFFLKHMDSEYKQKTAKLRSDTSKITWQVKIEDGPKLTDGWKEFALAHDLRIGDIVVFRQEKDLSFHVTLLGPSCCEIHYESEYQNNLRKKARRNPTRKAETSSLDPSCFKANVLRSTLRYDTLDLPKSFVRANDLRKRCGEIVLKNENGRSWTLALRKRKSSGTTYIRGGWRSYCRANGLKPGSFVTFKLIQRGTTLVLLRVSPKEPDEKTESLYTEANEIESLSTENSDEESSQDSQECSKKMEKKPRLIWKASASPSQNRFVTLTLTPYNMRQSQLFLPIPFTRMNGFNEETRMILLDKHGVNWSTELRAEQGGRRIKLVGGWKDFCKANGVKTGESIRLELIWEKETSCVLKFCSKVKP